MEDLIKQKANDEIALAQTELLFKKSYVSLIQLHITEHCSIAYMQQLLQLGLQLSSKPWTKPRKHFLRHLAVK